MADPYAFPVSTIDGFTQHGMELRDWIAGQVAASMAGTVDSAGTWTGMIDDASARIIAERSYTLADALLKERDRHDL